MAKFNLLAKRASKQNQEAAALANPEKAINQAEAYSRYLRKGHYNNQLEGLCNMCKKMVNSKNPKSIFDKKLFKRYGLWLQANLIYMNGSRRQVATLLTNADFARWKRASVKGTDHYSQVVMDHECHFDPEHIFHIRIGSNSLAQKGKTSHDIELDLPGDLAKGFVYYYAIKSLFNYTDSEDSFFVDAYGQAMDVSSFYGTYLYREMCKEMSVSELRFVDQRHQTASQMLCAQTQGTNTGMAHSKKTQEDTYDLLGEAAGIRNKYVANQKVLKNPVLIDHSDMDELFQGTLKTLSKTAQSSAVNQCLRKDFKDFQRGRKDRSGRCKVKSSERFNFFRAVYSLVSLELSTLILCHEFPSLRNRRLHTSFLRLISLDSKEALVIREDALNIGAHVAAKEESIVPDVMRLLKSSFRSLNVYRNKPGHAGAKHDLMCFSSVSSRFERVNRRMDKECDNNAKNYMEALQKKKR